MPGLQYDGALCGRRVHRFAVVALAVGLALPGAGSAPAETPIQPEGEGISFALRIAGDRTSFAQGELIPLELVFSSTIVDRYQLDAARYDRSGRLNLDSFELEPSEGAVDPLHDYFSASLHSLGGIRTTPMLGPEPEVIELVANEWLRFDLPGTYRLRVRTRRVYDLAAAGRPFEPSALRELVSEPVELEIVSAEPALADQRLDAALADLASGDEDRRKRGCSVLRHIGTRASIEALVDALVATEERWTDSCIFDAMLGLYGHPQRDLVVEELEAHLQSPTGRVNPLMVSTLARLKWLAGHPRPVDETKAAASRRTSDERAGFERMHQIYLARLASVADQKTGAARAAALATLVETGIPRVDSPQAGSRSPASLLASLFEQLPPSRQLGLLRRHWPKLRDPAMTPVLERMIENPPDVPGIGEEAPIDVAVTRLFDLEPERARAVIFADMLRPEPLLAETTLDLLTFEALPPEIEDTLLERLRAARPSGGLEKLSYLLARHGSPALLGQILELYDGQHFADLRLCWRAPFLAYLLRVDSAVGTARLRQAVAHAPSRPPDCRSNTLIDTADLLWNDALENLVTALLDGADLEVQRAAAQVLREHAGPGAEAALWRRMERWSAQWRDREEDLSYRPTDDDPFGAERMLGWELQRALRQGAGWSLGRDEIERLADLSVTQADREQVGMDLLWFGDEGEILLTVFSVEPPRFAVGRHSVDSVAALEARMVQFPEGSVFICWFDPNAEDADVRKALLDRLESFLVEHGMGLVRRRSTS